MFSLSPLSCLLLVVAYLILVRLLRYRRAALIPLKHGIRNRDDFRCLSADQAQDILRDLVEMEFPKFMGFAIVFALFKTYGIPTVSALLSTTGDLSGQETASRRTAETAVVLFEFCLNKPSSPRSAEAVARMNYLHGRYIRAGKISNDDLLYTLSVFALEPTRWIAKYEWRSFTEFELCATGTFWKSIGDQMQIDFSVLPSASKTTEWKDGLHWLQEIKVWSEEYERAKMLPAESNHRLALAHLDVIFINLPSYLKIIGHWVVAVLVGDRVRKAMKLTQSPKAFELTFNAALGLRKFCLRHFAPPRPGFRRKSYISETTEINGRYSMKEYLSHPWYVKPSFARRWGPKAWSLRMLGWKVPGDDSNRYNPEGYLIAEVGPKSLTKKGQKETEDEFNRLRSLRPGLCPFGSQSNTS